MNTDLKESFRGAVRSAYGSVARGERSGCGTGGGCCGGNAPSPKPNPRAIGYGDRELDAAVTEADLGLGCGNPHAMAALKEGETVLDLGSGAGFDAFIAGNQVGPKGRVIGVDMTPDMVSRARGNAAASELKNVEFRLGEIENLPVADRSVDAVLSNCVINLSADKAAVFREAYRVLKPGGRVSIADMVALKPLPPPTREILDSIPGCESNAATRDELAEWLRSAGFEGIQIVPNRFNDEADPQADNTPDPQPLVVSMRIEAVRPR